MSLTMRNIVCVLYMEYLKQDIKTNENFSYSWFINPDFKARCEGTLHYTSNPVAFANSLTHFTANLTLT